MQENAHKALPDTSADVYVQSNDGPFLLGVPADDTANTCIWAHIWGHHVGQYRKLLLHSSDLKYKDKKKLKGVKRIFKKSIR